jgi:hypothetical protein
LNSKSERLRLGAGHSKYYLELAAFGECCANNPFNFGMQNSAGVAIIACPWVCRGCVSRSCALHRQVADDSTKHELSDQNGGAGYLPGIGIGHDRLDLSLEARRNMTPFYIVRHLAGEFEELSCFRQLEDESAAMYFNIVHGATVRRRFTTQQSGEQCADYVLVARARGTDGFIEERKIALFNAT